MWKSEAVVPISSTFSLNGFKFKDVLQSYTADIAADTVEGEEHQEE